MLCSLCATVVVIVGTVVLKIHTCVVCILTLGFREIKQVAAPKFLNACILRNSSFASYYIWLSGRGDMNHD